MRSASTANPGRTFEAANQLLNAAAECLCIPPDVLHYRFLPWLTNRTDRIRHPLNHYTWDCHQCSQPWPCPPARIELVEAYAGDPSGLAELMGRLLIEAAAESGMPPTELTERFVTWPSKMLPSLFDAKILSPTGTRNTAIIECQQVLEAHWPDIDDRCPLCDVADCWHFRTAVAYLADYAPQTPGAPR